MTALFDRLVAEALERLAADLAQELFPKELRGLAALVPEGRSYRSYSELRAEWRERWWRAQQELFPLPSWWSSWE